MAGTLTREFYDLLVSLRETSRAQKQPLEREVIEDAIARFLPGRRVEGIPRELKPYVHRTKTGRYRIDPPPDIDPASLPDSRGEPMTRRPPEPKRTRADARKPTEEECERILADMAALQEPSLNGRVARRVVQSLFERHYAEINPARWRYWCRERMQWIHSVSGLGGSLTRLTKAGRERLASCKRTSRLTPEEITELLSADPRHKWIKTRAA